MASSSSVSPAGLVDGFCASLRGATIYRVATDGAVTHGEIVQQPDLWPTSLERVRARGPAGAYGEATVVVAGAGSSAYAASAVAAAWPDAIAIPTTELLVDAESLVPPRFAERGVLVSIARSGDSPESLGAIEAVRRRWPGARHVAITCNPAGQLARAHGIDAILLDPRTNDRSLAVTSSFSNTVLAGLGLIHGRALEVALPSICERVRRALPSFDEVARAIAARRPTRVTVLAPPSMIGAAREAALKVLEMSDGAVVAMAETVLGVRHGPLTFLRADGLVLCFASTDPIHRRYEEDLFLELRAKQLGTIAVVSPTTVSPALADYVVPASAPELPDTLRSPFEIVFAQLIALHLGIGVGVNPDGPSARGVINNVVQGVRLHRE